MREYILSDNRNKPCKCSEHTHTAKIQGKKYGNPLKPKSSSLWGSQIVKGFTGDKKTKQQASIPSKKPPLACPEISNQKNQLPPYHSRVKRSFIGDFPCSANAAQVHPHVHDCHHIRSPASHDLFLELDHLRELLRESKERELVLQSELLHFKESPIVLEFEKELDIKRNEIENLTSRVTSLEAERTSLLEQVASLSSTTEQHEENSRPDGSWNSISDLNAERKTSYSSLEIEVLELRRLNKEFQLQKRNLAFRLSSAESQLAALAKVTEVSLLLHSSSYSHRGCGFFY